MRERLYLSLLVGVLLCLAGWTAHAQLQRGGPARQAWEYKTWVLHTQAGGLLCMRTVSNFLVRPVQSQGHPN